MVDLQGLLLYNTEQQGALHGFPLADMRGERSFFRIAN